MRLIFHTKPYVVCVSRFIFANGCLSYTLIGQNSVKTTQSVILNFGTISILIAFFESYDLTNKASYSFYGLYTKAEKFLSSL